MNKKIVILLVIYVLGLSSCVSPISDKSPNDTFETTQISLMESCSSEESRDTLYYEGFVASMETDIYPTDVAFIRLVLTAKTPGIAFVYMSDMGYIYRVEDGEEIYLGGYTNDVCGTAIPDSPDSYATGICGVSLQSLRVSEGVTFTPGQYRVKYGDQVLDFELVTPNNE